MNSACLISTSTVHSISFFLTLSPLSLHWGTRVAKSEVASAENPVLPKVLSLSRDDVLSERFIYFYILLHIDSRAKW